MKQSAQPQPIDFHLKTDVDAGRMDTLIKQAAEDYSAGRTNCFNLRKSVATDVPFRTDTLEELALSESGPAAQEFPDTLRRFGVVS